MIPVFSRFGQFDGGINLPLQKHSTQDEQIRQPLALARLCVPLAPCGDEAAVPVVRPGDNVAAGDLLAKAPSKRSVDIVSPVKAVVGDIEATAKVSVGWSLKPSPAIELNDLGPLPAMEPVEPRVDPSELKPLELRHLLAAGPLIIQRLFPELLRDWLERSWRAKVSLLVLNGLQSQPYVTADHRLLVEFGEEVLGGLAILGRALQAERIMLAVARGRTSDYDHLPEQVDGRFIESVALPRKYPMEADPILLKVLTRKEMPSGGTTADIGAAVIDAATCQAVYRFIVAGVSPLGRVVTSAGTNQPKPQNLFAPFGADPLALANPAKPPLILGGPMLGKLFEPGVVITGAIDAVLALPPSPLAQSQPCLRCAWCSDHCPTRLNVAALNDLHEYGDVAAAAKLGAASCVGCGVCSYVCPAGLPLALRVRELKSMIQRTAQEESA